MISPIVVRFFSLAKCPSRANFDRSHNRSAKIFNFGPILGPFETKRVLLGDLGAQKRPDTRSMCLVTMIPAQSYQLAAVGTKSGLSGPSKSLWALKRALRGQNGPWSAVEVR